MNAQLSSDILLGIIGLIAAIGFIGTVGAFFTLGRSAYRKD